MHVLPFSSASFPSSLGYVLSSGFQSAKLEAELIPSSGSFAIFWAITTAALNMTVQSNAAVNTFRNIVLTSCSFRSFFRTTCGRALGNGASLLSKAACSQRQNQETGNEDSFHG